MLTSDLAVSFTFFESREIDSEVIGIRSANQVCFHAHAIFLFLFDLQKSVTKAETEAEPKVLHEQTNN